MVLFVLVVVVLLLGVATAVLVGWRRGLSVGMPEPTSTMAFTGLDGDELTSEAIAQVRFDRVLRGYRMDQVDAVLDRVRADLAQREAALAELAAAAGGGFTALSLPDDLSELADLDEFDDLDELDDLDDLDGLGEIDGFDDPSPDDGPDGPDGGVR